MTATHAADHPATTVAERGRSQPSGEQEVAFKKGDRIEHAAVGRATVTSGKLGPNGELKVRPDVLHHSGKKIVEIMARRATKLPA